MENIAQAIMNVLHASQAHHQAPHQAHHPVVPVLHLVVVSVDVIILIKHQQEEVVKLRVSHLNGVLHTATIVFSFL